MGYKGNMKVKLTQDVDGVGEEGAVVLVEKEAAFQLLSNNWAEHVYRKGKGPTARATMDLPEAPNTPLPARTGVDPKSSPPAVEAAAGSPSSKSSSKSKKTK